MSSAGHSEEQQGSFLRADSNSMAEGPFSPLGLKVRAALAPQPALAPTCATSTGWRRGPARAAARRVAVSPLHGAGGVGADPRSVPRTPGPPRCSSWTTTQCASRSSPPCSSAATTPVRGRGAGPAPLFPPACLPARPPGAWPCLRAGLDGGSGRLLRSGNAVQRPRRAEPAAREGQRHDLRLAAV